MTTDETGPGPANDHTLELAGERVTVERVSGRKASRAFALLRAIGDKVPGIVHAWGQFTIDYERTHFVELDRAQAMLRYGPKSLVDAEGVPERYPDIIDVGGEKLPHPKAGEPIIVPSPLEAMTEQDWAGAGNVLRRPESPGLPEQIAAIFPQALEVAEDHVYKLLALFTLSNEQVKTARKADGGIGKVLDERVDELLDDAAADELLELAVVCGEVVEDQFVRKAQQLGDRLGNALRLLGLDPTALTRQTEPEQPQTSPQTSSSTPSPTSPPSATDSGESTDGPPTPPSTPDTTSSPPSELASTASRSD